MADVITPSGVIGSDQPRVDGVAKVTGAALYGADHPIAKAAHAHLVTATIARGRIRKIDYKDAIRIPGVLQILTHENVGKAVRGGRHILSFGHMATELAPLRTSRIYYAGQIVAVVVAETLEIAREAARAIRVEYASKRANATFSSKGSREIKPKAMGDPELSVGNFKKAFMSAPSKVDAWYETPPQHHNPLELFQATCTWNGDQLTVWNPARTCAAISTDSPSNWGSRPRTFT